MLDNLSLLGMAPVLNIQLALDGLLIGAVLVLAAYGLALVWGVTHRRLLAPAGIADSGRLLGFESDRKFQSLSVPLNGDSKRFQWRRNLNQPNRLPGGCLLPVDRDNQISCLDAGTAGRGAIRDIADQRRLQLESEPLVAHHEQAG